jgi:hypothetical protein
VLNDTRLSELGHYSRSIAVKALNNIYCFGKVRCYLLDVFFLCLEEHVLLACYMLYTGIGTAYCNSKVFLLFPFLKETLTCLIAFPHFIRRMSLLRLHISAALLFVLPFVFFFVMLLDTAWCSAYV